MYFPRRQARPSRTQLRPATEWKCGCEYKGGSALSTFYFPLSTASRFSPLTSHLSLSTFHCLLLTAFLLLTGTPLFSQQRRGPTSNGEEPMSAFQAVNASIDTILQQYEQLTGNVLIKDSNLAANALPISISVPDPVPRSELIRLIESALLLNNFALIPVHFRLAVAPVRLCRRNDS